MVQKKGSLLQRKNNSENNTFVKNDKGYPVKLKYIYRYAGFFCLQWEFTKHIFTNNKDSFFCVCQRHKALIDMLVCSWLLIVFSNISQWSEGWLVVVFIMLCCFLTCLWSDFLWSWINACFHFANALWFLIEAKNGPVQLWAFFLSSLVAATWEAWSHRCRLTIMIF